MERGASVERQAGWFPLRGSWEEAVVTWNEQVEATFRRKRADSDRRTIHKDRDPVARPTAPA